MTLDEVLAQGQRFCVFFRERDVSLHPAPRRLEDSAIAFAEDRSGGAFVLLETGVFLRGSEGEHGALASSVEAFLTLLARGFTVEDLMAQRTTPSARSARGVLRWLGVEA